MGKTAPPKTLTCIQGLRGLAALLVMMFHIAELQRQIIAAKSLSVDSKILRGFWDNGYAGVDLFFVISGFIMVYVTRADHGSYQKSWRFLRARIARIYPLWWVYAGLMSLYFLVAYHTPADPARAAISGGVLPYLLKSFALVPQAAVPVLGLGWTLIHEMFFYFVFAGILLLPKRALPAALLVWSLWIGIAWQMGIPKPYAVDYLSLAGSMLSLEFIMGAFAAWMITRQKFAFYPVSILLGALGLGLGLFLYHADVTDVLVRGRVAVFGPPCVLLVYGLAARELSNQAATPKFMKVFGDWSYSLYLSHFLVLSALKRIFAKLSGYSPVFDIGHQGVWDNIAFTVAGVWLCILTAFLSYRYVERPLTRAAQQVLKTRTQVHVRP